VSIACRAYMAAQGATESGEGSGVLCAARRRLASFLGMMEAWERTERLTPGY